MALSLNKPKLDNLANEIWKSAERLRGKFKAYEFQSVNHPSGGVEPSHSDINITAQLKAAGEIFGIELLAHIIFNRVGYFSFLEAGRL